MAKQDDWARITLRIPQELHQRLVDEAGAKSLNAEIVDRLNQSFWFPVRIGREYQQSIARASDAEKAELYEGLEELLGVIFPKAVLLIDPVDHWRSAMEAFNELPERLRGKWKADTLRICRMLAKDPNWLPPEGEE